MDVPNGERTGPRWFHLHVRGSSNSSGGSVKIVWPIAESLTREAYFHVCLDGWRAKWQEMNDGDAPAGRNGGKK